MKQWVTNRFLCESGKWNLEAGKGYYVTRNCSSVIAFRIPEGDFSGFMLTASHCDSPCFKIKENAELGGSGNAFCKGQTERVGNKADFHNEVLLDEKYLSFVFV